MTWGLLLLCSLAAAAVVALFGIAIAKLDAADMRHYRAQIRRDQLAEQLKRDMIAK